MRFGMTAAVDAASFWSIIRKTFAALTALAFLVSAPWMQRARCITLRKQEELDWNEKSSHTGLEAFLMIYPV